MNQNNMKKMYENDVKQCDTVDPKSGKLSRTVRPHQPWWQIPASFHRSARGQPVGIDEFADSTRDIGRAYGAYLSTKLEAKEPKNPLTKNEYYRQMSSYKLPNQAEVCYFGIV